MKVVIITQGVSAIVEPIFSSEHQVVGIVEASNRGVGPNGRSFSKRVARRVLGHIYPRLRTLEQYSAKVGVPYFYLTKNSMPGFEKWLGEKSADIVVVFSMSQLLPERIFTIPKFGTINLHPSFLPKYRGPNPEFWQYFDFDLEPGVTVHHLDKGEDTGDIIYQERTPIEPGTRSGDLVDHSIGEVGVRLLLQALNDLEKGGAPRIAQPVSSPTRRARLVKVSEHADLINWSEWPIERVWHVLRGTEGWLNCIPQPKGLYTGQRWTIGEYRSGTKVGAAGTIRQEGQRYILICRDGEIDLTLRFSITQLFRHILLAGR